MKLNKVFSSILVLAMLCSLATVAFAAPASMSNTYTLEINASAKAVAAGETVTASVLLYSDDNADTIELNKGLSAVNVQVIYDAAKLTFASATNDADNFTLTSNAGDNGAYYTWEATLNSNVVSIAKDKALFTITFTAKEDIADITADIFSTRSITVVDDNFDGAESSMLGNVAVKVTTAEPAGPTENVAEFVKDTVELTVEGETHNFTDVPVYEGTTSATSFKLKAVYAEGENYLKFNGSETIDVSNIKVDGEGTVTFQVAIIGKPASVTIDKLVIE